MRKAQQEKDYGRVWANFNAEAYTVGRGVERLPKRYI